MEFRLQLHYKREVAQFAVLISKRLMSEREKILITNAMTLS